MLKLCRGFARRDLTRRQWLIRIGLLSVILVLVALSPELMGLDITWALLVEPELLVILVPMLFGLVMAKWDTLRWLLRMNYATVSDKLRRG